jgi:hypothetical protein
MRDEICTAAFFTSLVCLSYPDLGWNWSFISASLTEPISTFCRYSSPEIISCSNTAVLPWDRFCCAWPRCKICTSGSRPSEPPSSGSRASWPMMTCRATFVGPRTDRDSSYNSCPLLKRGIYIVIFCDAMLTQAQLATSWSTVPSYKTLSLLPRAMTPCVVVA